MEIEYPVGTVVWVKLEGGRWWPGQVTDDPDSSDATKGLRKPPLAVVKFFDEDCYHVVKSEQHIYPFECDKKDEFLTRGKDFKMSGKDNFSLRLKFDADVSKAEALSKPASKTGTTSNSSPTIVSSLPKVTKYASYMKIPPAERFDYGANQEENVTVQSFVSAAHSDIGLPRIRKQPSTPKAKETALSCDSCNFQTTRMDNFIRHHKSHSDPYKFHPGIETEPRSVFEKFGALKSKKRAKDGSRNTGNKIKRPRKSASEKGKNESSPVSRKKKTEQRRNLFAEGRYTPRKKKNKVVDKKPFSNPFEDDDEEEAKNDADEKAKQESAITEDELDMDPAIGDRKREELPPVEWEEFIKGSPLKVPVQEEIKNDATEDKIQGMTVAESVDSLRDGRNIKEESTDELADTHRIQVGSPLERSSLLPTQERSLQPITDIRNGIANEETSIKIVNEELKLLKESKLEKDSVMLNGTEDQMLHQDLPSEIVVREVLHQLPLPVHSPGEQEKKDDKVEKKPANEEKVIETMLEEEVIHHDVAEENNIELSYEQIRPECNQAIQSQETQIQFAREHEMQSLPTQDIHSTETQEYQSSHTQEIPSVATQVVCSPDTREEIHSTFAQDMSMVNNQNVPLDHEHRVHLPEDSIQPIEEMPVDSSTQDVTEEIQDSEIVVDDTVEMSTEEIVVTDGSLQAGEIMVGEEIEVQEIEIQSDGMTGNEIVLGEEVVMQYLPEERDGGLVDPMVPANINTEHSDMVLETEQASFGGEPRQIFSSVYTSDHSMMAADPLSKQTRYNSSGIYIEGKPESIYTVSQQPFQTIQSESRNDDNTGLSQDVTEGRNS